MKKNLLILFTLVLPIIIMGCEKKSSFPENDKPNVVATTTLVGDLVHNIGGDKINLKTLMGPGIDPHMYKASAGDVTAMQKADMIIYSGIHLEGKMEDIFENLEKIDKKVLAVSKDIDRSKLLDFATNPGNYDPHIWFDVSMWKESALAVNQGLKELMPEEAETFDKNLESYLLELDELDRYVKMRSNEIPREKRILVTAHDAFGYFGEAYDFQVKGLQGISTAAEAGTRDMRNLANFIVENQVKSVFVETSVPRKSIMALQEAVKAQGFDVKIGGELYSDSTGDESMGTETYIETFRANIDTIVDGLK